MYVDGRTPMHFNGIIVDSVPEHLMNFYLETNFVTLLSRDAVIEGRLPYREQASKFVSEFVASQRPS